MPTDPSVILAAQSPQIDIGQLFAEAYKIKEMKQGQEDRNALKSFFSDPGNLDDKGVPTDNALKTLMTKAPTIAFPIVEQTTKVREEQAATDKRVLDQKLEKDNILQKSVREPAATAYDNAIKDGKTPEQATSIAQTVYTEGLTAVKNSGEFGQQDTDQFASNFDINRVRTAMKVNQLHQPGKKGSDFDIETDANGNTYRLDKVSGETFGVSGPDVEAGKPFTPHGRVSKIGGGGTARSAVAMATQRYVQEHPDATADDIAEFGAQYKRTQVAGTADVESAAGSLKNIEKTRGMVRASEGNANREADLVLSLVDKGGGNLPRWLNKPLQDLKVSGLGSTDAAELRTALESFKNEYVKVLSTQSGVSGGLATDSARKEADGFINDGLSIEQIKHNIQVMRKSMNNRSASLDEAYGSESGRVQDAKRGPAAASGNAPPASMIPEGHARKFKGKDGKVHTFHNVNGKVTEVAS